ncbi:uncharacterized protein LOC134209346 [Armigeres subalbatus]|uniref:uncharacterized protein LOC134209346 n=1 Tax=Armigeres subalbatus TaxID=124917 RepID=UPI002ED4BCF8
MDKESYEQLNRVVGEFETNLMMLDKLGENTEGMSTILQHMVCQRLEPNTLRNWENHYHSTQIPRYKDLISYLKEQCLVLRSISSNRPSQGESKKLFRSSVLSHSGIQQVAVCPFCGEQAHSAFKCNRFCKMKISERAEEAKRKSLCLNCLSPGHIARFCTKGSCHTCGRNHHTLLHSVPPSVSQSRPAQQSSSQTGKKTQAPNSSPPQNSSKPQANNSISPQQMNASNEAATSQTRTTFAILCPTKSYSGFTVEQTRYQQMDLSQGINLADPEYYNPSTVDIIIGAEIFFDLLVDGHFKLAEGGPVLQNTQLGWVVSGKVSESSRTTTSLTAVACTEERLDDLLTRFWELESCHTTSTMSLEESQCERIYNETTTRDVSGRFVVTLPKKPFLIDRLGESRSIALRRFTALERRLDANAKLKEDYSSFIHEYLEMGHMKEIQVDPDVPEIAPYPYYLPHHAVVRPESTTTKLRVVFDASCATMSGVSLNEALMVGPVVQEELLSIVLRFRLHKFAIVADIAKMYRMVNIASEDQQLQRILWRDCSSETIRTFELNTRLAEEGAQQYPLASSILSKDFYVDDMLTGANSVEEGIMLYQELSHLLETAKFTLRKWSSNSPEILAAIPEPLKDDRTSLELEPSKATIKTLGLSWEPRSDYFRFTVPQWSDSTEINKRIILSDFARLFDPLGLVGPVVVQAKIFIQNLWKQKCSWNETLGEDLQQWWLDFRHNLADLSTLKVPRWLAFDNSIVSLEIHGFCDASEKAYGACIYLRCTSFDGQVTVNLITAKSRVAPLDDVQRKRKKISISSWTYHPQFF